MSNLGLLVLVLGFQSVDVLNAGAPEANERCLMRDGHPGGTSTVEEEAV